MSNYRILVCDDDGLWRNAIHDHMPKMWKDLLSEDVHFEVCSDLVEEQATRPVMSFSELSNYDALVLDLFWKDLDKSGEEGRHGLTLCQKIRDRYPDLPIVIVSAKANRKHLALLMEHDVCGYLSKGSSLPPICVGIANAIHRSILDRSSRVLYQTVRKTASLSSAWNAARVQNAASAVWRREGNHDKWRGFWDVWNRSLSAKHLRLPIDVLRDYFQENDLMILGVHPGMRGHLEHVLHVYFTGYVISHACPALRATAANAAKLLLGSDFDPKLQEEYWSNFQIAWLVCATLHDTGYCVELLPELHQKVRNLINTFPFVKTQEFKESWDCTEILWDTIPQCKEALERIPILLRYERYDASWITRNVIFKDPKTGVQRCNHGVASALLFLSRLHQNCEQLKRDNKSLFTFLEWAGVSMTFHSLKYQGRASGVKLVLTVDPLSTLLLLCDELQLWDRERPDQVRESNPFRRVSLTNLEIDDNAISAEVTYTPFSGSLDNPVPLINKLEGQIQKDKELLASYLQVSPLKVSISSRIQGWEEQLPKLDLG